ncbi:Hypothetical protein NTJ_07232 [Nesidiocoris tenuis]|uniref:Uncharacterized protein n=1 Tax=Nesidiocoris tenuis TaxID=355587 RepID=A0ABN7AQE2_9HEMI|nr:Hypothetical protein NTJ_07232 [Nesidiocoris tenuis]
MIFPCDCLFYYEMRSGEEMCGHKERIRARLQELMVQEGLIPSHPLVTATSLHLNYTTATKVATSFGAQPNDVSYYQGCDMFYMVPHRAATPLSDINENHQEVLSKWNQAV